MSCPYTVHERLPPSMRNYWATAVILRGLTLAGQNPSLSPFAVSLPVLAEGSSHERTVRDY